MLFKPALYNNSFSGIVYSCSLSKYCSYGQGLWNLPKSCGKSWKPGAQFGAQIYFWDPLHNTDKLSCNLLL